MKGNIMRTSIRSAAAIAAIATVGILGLTACSSSEETTPAPTPEVSAPPATPTAPPTPTPPPLPVESIPAEVVDPAETTPAETDPAVSEMVAPIVVDGNINEVTAVIGNVLDFVVADPTTTTIAVDNPAVLTITQGTIDNGVTLNPGATAVAEGVTVVTLTNADGTTRTVKVYVAAPDTATEETPVEAVPAEDPAAVTESAPAAE